MGDSHLQEPQNTAISITVNGHKHTATIEARALLVDFLRDQLGLTGTHVGCDTGQCGACVVHVNGEAVKSCTVLAVQTDGGEVLTIEGVAQEGLHPVQQAFADEHGLQCGFCTPGMVMTSIDMLRRHPNGLDEATVRRELEGNLCRCTGYENIVNAVMSAAQKVGG